MQSINNSNVLELTEVKLMRLKELKDAIKVLEAEYSMIADELKSGYFAEHVEFKTARGLVLATYKESIRTSFDSSRFKKENPATYELYLDLKSVRTFLLK